MKNRLARVVPLALFFGWVAAANLTRLANNDIWLQLKVGADVVQQHALPQVDVYSAVAAGRPFVAHEWLASVLFYAVHAAAGGAGLSILQAMVALGCAALLWFALAADARERGGTLLVATASMFLVSARLTLRPHVFSLLGLAAWMFAVEKWRRTRRLRDLVWLVPVQLVWANLHGEAVVAPVLFALLAVVTFACARVPRLQEADAAPFTVADSGRLALMAGATLAATLINPYGDRLLWFAFDMGANDFMRRYVFEWTPTLDGRAFAAPFTWVYLAELLLMWGALVARRRKRPVVDLALALVATAASLSAKRLVPYVAILGLPIIARALPAWRRRPAVESLFGAALAALAIARGLPYLGAGDGARTALGFAEALATREVAELKQRALRGVMFDEYVDGALVIYALYPDVRPVMDSRIDVYGRALYEEYLAAQSSPERFAQYLAKYDVSIVMLSRERTGAFEWLRRNGEWRLVLESERRFVFAR